MKAKNYRTIQKLCSWIRYARLRLWLHRATHHERKKAIKYKYLALATLTFFINIYPAKFVGLMQVRNEAPIVEMSLRAMAQYTDAIVILDDGSVDETVSIIKSLTEELKIEKIILNNQSAWENKSELYNKQLLIDAARQIEATHFIHLDADEILSAKCLENNWLKNKMLSLEKGEALSLRMIHPWKGIEYYRDDAHISPNKLGIIGFMHDDGVSTIYDNKKISESGFIHVGRLPITSKVLVCHDVEYCILHFKFIDFNFLKTKIAWYMCLEKIRLEEDKTRTVDDINAYYSHYKPCFKEENIVLRPIKKEWLNYSFLDYSVFINQSHWRKQEIEKWLERYSKEFFQPLDIWKLI